MKPVTIEDVMNSKYWPEFKAEYADEICEGFREFILSDEDDDADKFHDTLTILAQPLIEQLADDLARDAAVDAEIDDAYFSQR